MDEGDMRYKMDEGNRLRIIAERRGGGGPDGAIRLGAVAEELMDRQISPRVAKFGGMAELWGQLLPAELRRHCRLEGVNAGCLSVLVDSPSYMYELQLCSRELLGQLQRECPRAQIKRIKIALG